MTSANLFRLSTSELNVSRISNIEQCFGDNGIPLLRTGRVLIAEGVLLKVCRKRPKKRQFFLFNDLLVYGNIVIGKKKYTKQQIIELDDVRANLLAEDNKSFQVISPKKSFTVYTNTSLEAAKWVEYINKYAKDCTDGRESGGIGAGGGGGIGAGGGGGIGATEAAPVWIPDKAQQRCMICGAAFTVLNRRHHCRRCGHLVCQTCSNRKWLLPAQSKKPVRVCASCHAFLQQPQQQQQRGATVEIDEVEAVDAAPAGPSFVASASASAEGSSSSDCDSD